VRFLLDHDVDAAVGKMLRQRKHQCWTAGAAGLATATDDDLTVWATEHLAAVVSTDREFGRRRMKNAIGHHVWLRCLDWEAADVLDIYISGVIELLEGRVDVTVRVSKDAGIDASSNWD
jgi:predicted nuclease of predicted toxin-antitoxin system